MNQLLQNQREEFEGRIADMNKMFVSSFNSIENSMGKLMQIIEQNAIPANGGNFNSNSSPINYQNIPNDHVNVNLNANNVKQQSQVFHCILL